MKVSLSWLRDYIPVDTDVAELADAFTMAGLEVEALTDRYAYLERVVVGRIVDIAAHPDADGLSLCKVDVGSESKAIVCGASNIEKGHLVPVALPGVQLPSGEKIEAGRIRGQVSEGMLCSEAELAIGTDRSGILLLPQNETPGRGIAAAMGLCDIVFEFDLTPNRSDCLSIIGIAREAAAILKVPLKVPAVDLPAGGTPIGDLASVTIEAPDACPRYSARLVSDIKVAPSPFWLQDKLQSVGLRAINNVVDVTNFVMMETGQPLHAFDFNRLAEHRIVVKKAQEGDTFVTLDGVNRSLPPDALMICDGKSPVAVGGIMGGLDSEIEEDTAQVLIESAYFNPISIRRTAKRLGLSTESSHRFERGVDPEGTMRALDRATRLVADLAKGHVAGGVIDQYPAPVSVQPITLSVKRTNRLLGTAFTPEQISSHLQSIELAVEPVDGNDTLRVVAPTFRVDLKRPQDLMEEVARLSGYNAIPTTHPVSHVIAKKRNKRLRVRDTLRRVLAGCGFSEIITYSFIGANACDKLSLAENDRRRQVVTILNPLTEDQDVMRTSLLPGLLDTMFRNAAQRNDNLMIFELGNVFFNTPARELPDEVEMISALWTGAHRGRCWLGKQRPVDFYDVKGVVESLCRALNIGKVRFKAPGDTEYPYLRPGHTAQVIAKNDTVGVVGEIGKNILAGFALKQPAFCFDLNFDRLVDLTEEEKRVKPISRFPATDRDVALIVNEAVEAQAVLDFIHSRGQELIEDIEIFDVYKGKPIPSGKKSMALKLTYRSFKRNLTDSEVNDIHKTIIGQMLKEFDAQLPTK
jgi:phenylalanyl-tRNA synthetase beta chain